MFRPPFRPVLVVAAVTATALLGACSDDIAAPGPTADATTTTTTAAPTTTTQPSAPTTPEDEVAAAYVDAFSAYFRAGESPTATDGLEAFFGDAALEAVLVNLDGMVTGGILSDFSKGDPTIAIESITREGETTARLVACTIDTGQQINASSGRVTDDVPVSRRSTATLELTDRWRVIEHHTIAEWPHAGGCAG